MNLKPTESINSNTIDILESEIETFFLENPQSLGLGEIEIQESQMKQKYGILDLLAYQSETNTYFEIEIMRRQADEWHIAHVLDYWANERRNKPYSNHMCVLVTESCRGRYNNLLQTLPNVLPLIVMELDILKSETSDECMIRCIPIYYPENIGLNKHKTVIPKKSSDDILTSKISMLLISHILDDTKLVGCTMREISDKTNISLGAVGNIMRTLTDRGFITMHRKKSYN